MELDRGAADDGTSQTTKKRKHGGLRLDADGKALGGRPNKVRAAAKTPGVVPILDFFERERKEGEERDRARLAAETVEADESKGMGSSDSSLSSDKSQDVEDEDVVAAVPRLGGNEEADDPVIKEEMLSLMEREFRKLSSSLAEQIKGVIANESQAAVAAVDEACNEAATKIEELQGLLSAQTQLEVLQSDKTATNRKGNVICLVCTENRACLVDGRQLRSKWLASGDGYPQDHNLVANWNAHLESHMHRLCDEADRERRANPIAIAAQKAQARRALVTKILLLAAAYGDIEKHSFRSFQRLLYFPHMLGVDVGDRCHSRKSRQEMSRIFAEHGREHFRQFLQAKNAVTGRLPHLGLSVDKETTI
mmetsp:Transcript_11654/g.37100  ORF Transcript_11654/g.37100 Transcript_11654/m.37100 type:complete len:365 (-) Transcript_11654:380-1474(-)